MVFCTKCNYPAESVIERSCLSVKAKRKHQGNFHDGCFLKVRVSVFPAVCVNTENPGKMANTLCSDSQLLPCAMGWGHSWFLFASIISPSIHSENVEVVWGGAHQHSLMRSQSLIWKKGHIKCRQMILQSCNFFFFFKMQFFLYATVEEHTFPPL